ncbi:MAG: sugar transferase [Bacteroidia bacterium]|jgi:lipopolysaccharide/colanic/teichoic acid biosynthesis glycosyltransferase|nr:sugar transferase [Bacteroidia bacterium]
MLKRLFDIVFSIIILIVLFPLFLIISLWIIIDDGFPVFYLQERIGKDFKPFKLIKFRTMYKDADKKGLLTVSSKDNRITPSGYYLRKFKLDELPQFINVLKGEMSIVGPRPEVKKYVELYNDEQKKVLSVKPGITDEASLKYIDENDVLARSENPEWTYINEVMPEKLKINLKYIKNQNLLYDLKIIFWTAKKMFFRD